MEEYKNCPYCGEKILSVAKKCRHCHQWLEEQPVVISKDTDMIQKKNTALSWILAAVVLILAAVVTYSFISKKSVYEMCFGNDASVTVQHEITSVIDKFILECDEFDCCSWDIFNDFSGFKPGDECYKTHLDYSGILTADGTPLSVSTFNEIIESVINVTGASCGGDLLTISYEVDMGGKNVDLPEYLIEKYGLNPIYDNGGGPTFGKILYLAKNGYYFVLETSFGQSYGSYGVYVSKEVGTVSQFLKE